MTPDSRLEDLQLALQRFVLNEPSGIVSETFARRGLDLPRRLGIYRSAYSARLADALRDTYGHTASYLGAQAFGSLAAAYIEAHPSTQGNLRWFGASFAPWLGHRHANAPEVAELATLDWALRRAFDGPDSKALRLEDLAAIAPDEWPTVRLELQPTVERLRLVHNSVAMWHALDADENPPRCARLAEACDLLVWRRGLQPHFRSLSPFEGAALDRVAAGMGFAATCESLALRYPDLDTARAMGTLLRRWVDEEVLRA